MQKRLASKNAVLIHDQMHFAGGGERVAAEITSCLNRIGYRVTLVSETRNLKPEVAEQLRGVTILSVPLSFLPYALAHLLRVLLSSFLSLVKPRCMVVDTTALLFGAAVADINYVHFPGLMNDNGPAVSRPARMGRRFMSMLFLLLSRLTAHRDRYLLFNSNWTKTETLRHERRYVRLAFSAHVNEEVVYPPVNLERLLSQPMGIKKSNTVCILSRFSRVKCLEQVIAVAELTPVTRYILAGRLSDRDYFEELLEQTKIHNLEGRIEFRKDISEEAKATLLAESAVVLHLAKEEHFGISLVEAMAAGAIVIAMNFGGAREFIPERWLYDRYDQIPSLVAKAQLDWNPRLAEHQRSVAREFAEQKFVDRFTSIVSELDSR